MNGRPINREADRNQRKALGKGLSALLPNRPTVPEANGTPHTETPNASTAALPEHFESFQNIPLTQLFPSGEQPRTNFDREKLMELAQSIRENGVIQPITVQKIGPEKYNIIAGERRWHAAGLAGLKEIPALVRTMDEPKRLEIALIENIQREDLNPIEIAFAFDRLVNEHGLTHEQIAERTGKDRSTVTNLLRLLNLSPFVRDELERGHITVGHGRALLNIANEGAQIDACKQVLDKQLSVRATEQLVKRLSTPQPSTEEQKARKVDPNIRAAIDEMQTALGTKVHLNQKTNGSGRLEIEFYSQDDLDRIYSVIVKQ